MRTKDLLILIKNLSKADKKSFTTLAEKQDGVQYLFLYRELEKISKIWSPEDGPVPVSDAALALKLKQKKIKTSLATLRTYIADTILKSLRLLNDNENKRDKIESKIKNASILENRGLLLIAAQTLSEALEMALDYQYHALAIDILKSLVQIESQIDSRTYSDSIKRYLEQIKDLVGYLDLESHHYMQYFHTFLRFRLGSQSVGTPINFTQDVEEQVPSTFLSKMYYFQMLSLNALYMENTKDACVYSEQLLSLWQEKKGIKEERLGQYVRHVYNYLNFCVVEKNFQHYELYLNELKSIRQKGGHFDLEAELNQNILLAEQVYYLNTNQIESAEALYPTILSTIKKYEPKISKARVISFRYNNIIALFALKDFKQALNQCLDLIEIEYHAHRHDLQLLAKLFQIIIYLELDSHKELDTVATKLGRLFRHAETGRDFERMVLRNLYKLVKTHVENLPKKEKEKKNKKHFELFYKDLLQYKKDTPRKLRTGFEEINCWVQSKVEGVTFREMLSR